MEPTTYSFADLSGAIASPDIGTYIFTGKGIGQISIIMQTENTVQSMAADGAVMTSKIIGKNAQIQIQCQQTSALHKWLLAAHNSLYIADTEAWARIAAVFRNTSDGTSHICTGMAFGKIADKVYAAQGQMVSWTFFVADAQQLPIS
jgi:hypothetical protein